MSLHTSKVSARSVHPPQTPSSFITPPLRQSSQVSSSVRNANYELLVRGKRCQSAVDTMPDNSFIACIVCCGTLQACTVQHLEQSAQYEHGLALSPSELSK
ncbi:hypothetical protein IG631_21129 [Alternaria alternata]|nr:hypothetical protein IG631_21129 [Alternaria alternata]